MVTLLISQMSLSPPTFEGLATVRPDLASTHAINWYASSRGKRAYCYVELAVSSPAVAETISVLTAISMWDGQAEWAWKIPAWLIDGHQSPY